jgi:hypothetical protein
MPKIRIETRFVGDFKSEEDAEKVIDMLFKGYKVEQCDIEEIEEEEEISEGDTDED